jgi:HAD superfamily phosphatase (TIGR01668 family)
MFLERIEQIDLDDLKRRGFDTLILDLDNTIVGWRSGRVSPGVLEWLQYAEDKGFRMCIVSNSLLRGRVKKMSGKLGIPAIPRARKPRERSFLQAVGMLESTIARSVVIGDQVFTDILGGNRLGFFTILVLPVDKREFFATILARTAEKFILFKLKRKGLLREVEYNSARKCFQST